MSGRGGPPLPKRTEKIERFGGGGWEGHGDYMREKEAKLQAQQAARTLESEALKGVSVHLDGMSSERSADLIELVSSHGGIFYQFYHGDRVTHFVVNTLHPGKVKQLTTHVEESRRSPMAALGVSVLLVARLLCHGEAAAVFYVSPTGSDGALGLSRDAPVKTLL